MTEVKKWCSEIHFRNNWKYTKNGINLHCIIILIVERSKVQILSSNILTGNSLKLCGRLLPYHYGSLIGTFFQVVNTPFSLRIYIYHDVAEILLKVGIKHQSINHFLKWKLLRIMPCLLHVQLNCLELCMPCLLHVQLNCISHSIFLSDHFLRSFVFVFV
jgi:hypothetical protein